MKRILVLVLALLLVCSVAFAATEVTREEFMNAGAGTTLPKQGNPVENAAVGWFGDFVVGSIKFDDGSSGWSLYSTTFYKEDYGYRAEYEDYGELLTIKMYMEDGKPVAYDVQFAGNASFMSEYNGLYGEIPVPKTGDGMNLPLYACLALLSAAALAVVGRKALRAR